nr:E3 ubiquitin protein ligase CBL B [Hymenolepis microstoma]
MDILVGSKGASTLIHATAYHQMLMILVNNLINSLTHCSSKSSGLARLTSLSLILLAIRNSVKANNRSRPAELVFDSPPRLVDEMTQDSQVEEHIDYLSTSALLKDHFLYVHLIPTPEMGLGDYDLKPIISCVGKTYQKIQRKQESLNKQLKSSKKYLDEALNKLCALKDSLNEIELGSQSRQTNKSLKEYLKALKKSMESLMKGFESIMKGDFTDQDPLLKYTHFFHHFRIISHPGYLKYGTYTSSFDTLQSCKTPGSYIFRISSSKLGFWSIAYISPSNQILQAMCYDWSVVFSVNYGHQQGLYLYPSGQYCADDFTDVCRRIAPSPQNPSGELCIRCGTNPANTRMEPCGHSCCRACYKEILVSPKLQLRNLLMVSRDSHFVILIPTIFNVKLVSKANVSNSIKFMDPCCGDHEFGMTMQRPPRPINSPNLGEAAMEISEYSQGLLIGKNQEFNTAVEKVLAFCPDERGIVDFNLRYLTLIHNFDLSDSVTALIQAHGNRDEAARLLGSGGCYADANDIAAGSPVQRDGRSK